MTKYKTEEERKAAQRESSRRYYQVNKTAIAERKRKYRETPYGRALQLLNAYRKMDKRKGFGDAIDFDAQWIVENIFTKSCAHCDCTDWRELGCNRIDNDLPHIKSNVEPCCWKHNHELARTYIAKELSILVAQFDKISGELVAVWESANEAARQLGYDQGHISACCRGERKSAYGFVWRKISKEEYETLKACLTKACLFCLCACITYIFSINFSPLIDWLNNWFISTLC